MIYCAQPIREGQTHFSHQNCIQACGKFERSSMKTRMLGWPQRDAEKPFSGTGGKIGGNGYGNSAGIRRNSRPALRLVRRIDPHEHN